MAVAVAAAYTVKFALWLWQVSSDSASPTAVRLPLFTLGFTPIFLPEQVRESLELHLHLFRLVGNQSPYYLSVASISTTVAAFVAAAANLGQIRAESVVEVVGKQARQ